MSNSALNEHEREQVEKDLFRNGQINWGYARDITHRWNRKRFEVTAFLLEKGHLVGYPTKEGDPPGFEIVSLNLNLVWNPQLEDGAYVLLCTIEDARNYGKSLGKLNRDFSIRRIEIVE